MVWFGSFLCHFVRFDFGFVHQNCRAVHSVRNLCAFRHEVRAFRLGIYTVRLEVGIEAQM